jgi:hypothetical protein
MRLNARRQRIPGAPLRFPEKNALDPYQDYIRRRMKESGSKRPETAQWLIVAVPLSLR